MRVTHVITRLIVGGAQENTIGSVLGLRRKPGLDVRLISGPTTGPEGTLEPQLQGTGALEILPTLVRPVRPLADWRAYRGLISIFERDRPHLVHTHSGKAGVLGRLAAAKARVPLVVHTIHGPSFGKFQGALANALFTGAERAAGRVTGHFVVVANAMRDQYLAAGIGQLSQYTRILSGFDLLPFQSATNDARRRAQLGIGPEDVVIGKIARLVELKGHEDLFAVAPELVRHCPRVKFLLVGDGYYRARFEARARERGLAGHFIFTGLVPPERVPELVGIMDLVVHLSAREGLARALPQALAAGRPVVAYDCDGAREVCFDGETGFLVRPGDLGTLGNRLKDLVENAQLRQRLGATGQAFALKHFAMETMVESLYGLYRRLALEKGLPAPPESA